MPTVIDMPALSSTMKRGKVVKWCRSEGAFLEKGDILFEVETDKVNVEVETLTSGFLRKIIIKEGIEVPIKTPIAILADTRDEDISSLLDELSLPRIPAGEETHEKGPREVEDKMERIKISPLARRIAEKNGVNINVIKGSGPGGRITKRDIEAAIAEIPKAQQASVKASEEEGDARAGKVIFEDLELTKMRRVIAQRLQASKMNAPHFYVDLTADASGIIQLKEDLQRASDGSGANISLNDILIKIVSHALKDFPMLHASYLEDRIRVHRAINIGVAVAVDGGLVVPVLRDVDQKTLSQISRDVKELTSKARNKKLLPDEYQGGTFTVTNMGMFGVETFHAIINPPESGILAIGAITPKPVVVEGEITIRPCLTLSLSVDHRVVDGALAARFLSRVRELTESPCLMMA